MATLYNYEMVIKHVIGRSLKRWEQHDLAALRVIDVTGTRPKPSAVQFCLLLSVKQLALVIT